jgi:hypothetical protein
MNPGPAKKPAHQLIHVRQYIDTKEQNVKEDENRTQFHRNAHSERTSADVSNGLAVRFKKPGNLFALRLSGPNAVRLIYKSPV